MNSDSLIHFQAQQRSSKSTGSLQRTFRAAIKPSRATSGGIVFSIAIALTLTACTVIPKPVKSTVVGFSGTNQNGGIISVDKQTHIGVIDEHKRQVYNALIKDYGAEFLPAIKPDDGLEKLPDGNWRIDAEHLVDLLDMEERRRSTPRKPD